MRKDFKERIHKPKLNSSVQGILWQCELIDSSNRVFIHNTDEKFNEVFVCISVHIIIMTHVSKGLQRN